MGSLSAVILALVAGLQAGAWQSSSPQVAIEAGTAAVTFRNTGRAGVDLWRQADSIGGSYTVRVTLRKRAGRRMEGYGILFGGRGLGTDAARYAYVMVRGDGSVLVKRRDGAATPVVRDWTTHTAVRPDDAQGRAENILQVHVTARDVAVSVNGIAVATVPVAGLPTDGVVGLRVSHSLELEVQDLTVLPDR